MGHISGSSNSFSPSLPELGYFRWLRNPKLRILSIVKNHYGWNRSNIMSLPENVEKSQWEVSEMANINNSSNIQQVFKQYLQTKQYNNNKTNKTRNNKHKKIPTKNPPQKTPNKTENNCFQLLPSTNNPKIQNGKIWLMRYQYTEQ